MFSLTVLKGQLQFFDLKILISHVKSLIILSGTLILKINLEQLVKHRIVIKWKFGCHMGHKGRSES